MAIDATGVDFDPGSYRDRTNRVFRHRGRIYRALSPEAVAEWQFVRETRFFQRGMAEGLIVTTEQVATDAMAVEVPPRWTEFLQHETIPFISYPYEWSFGMLQDAALLQLDLLKSALAEGAILKDATPYNTQFRGAMPVFIDVPSFERHRSGQPWTGYRQFCQQFLYPLMLQAYRGIDFQPLLRGRLDGITPQQFLKFLSWTDLARAGVFSHVYLHAQLERHLGNRTAQVPQSMQQHGFQTELIVRNVQNLIRLVSRLKWQPRSSQWSDYDCAPSPAQVDGGVKAAFVGTVAAQKRWNRVWDLGCNAGRYARIVAAHADLVVAMDFDHLTIERLYRSLKEEGETRILPLVCNLADPSPSLGWRCSERRDMVSRGRPDLVLCLALIHHLVMRENILLPDLIDWLAGLGASTVIEFVDKADPQVQSLLANRHDQYHDYSQDQFEKYLSDRFVICGRQPLPSGTRTLYHAQPRQRSGCSSRGALMRTWAMSAAADSDS